ncbi:UDP-N-acetylglucosamine 2-epimerase (hydrolyzing) [Patescibacteria group bacterium]|nr:UDP-N-acetylglucosamine 2-epimerase (hydrolyzing) [Patescibacteria group bacterium]
MKRRKIAVITGRRAEYGITLTVLNAMRKRGLNFTLIVTGMHISKKFGNTIQQIKKDGFSTNHMIEAFPLKDDGFSMVEAFGKYAIGFGKEISKIKPDLILVLADLGEALAGAVVGTYMNIPVAHLHGGEVSGSVDESIRHAITKLAHVHLPATKEGAKRIIGMGEQPWRVHIVGAPGLDAIKQDNFTPRDEIIKKFNLDKKRANILVVQHPDVIETENVVYHIRGTIDAVVDSGYRTIVIYPNMDAGGRKIVDVLKNYKRNPRISIFNNLVREDYLGLLNVVDVMVGNSSSGLIEAPSFKLPVVNVGDRQKGRMRAFNVIDVGYGKKEITKGINKALKDKKFREILAKCKNPYGDGKSGERIAKLLSTINIDKRLLQKRMTY